MTKGRQYGKIMDNSGFDPHADCPLRRIAFSYGGIILKKIFRTLSAAAAAMAIALSMSAAVYADETAEIKTSVTMDLTDIPGQYPHWDGVSPVTQFKYSDGSACIAVHEGDELNVQRISSDGTLSTIFKTKLKHPEYGTITCDAEGNFYVVTGEVADKNTQNRKQQTIFITKYNKSGKEVWTTGNDGSSSLQYYHDDGHNTQLPFDSGVSAAVSGNRIAVNYGRFMYNGHQGNSIWVVGTNTMANLRDVAWISTHSFAHRTVPVTRGEQNGFVFLSEGDCYPRAFSTYAITFNSIRVDTYKYNDPFHFWVEENALDKKAYGQLNNNYAHLAGMVALKTNDIALVGTAAPALSAECKTQKEQLFIQIYDPFRDVKNPVNYTTYTDEYRTGLSGGNGNEKVTDYGIKWLDVALEDDATIENPQVLATDDDRIVIIYEKGNRYPWTVGWHWKRYDGIWYMILDNKGNVVQEEQLFSKTARLNPCEMPVYSDGSIYWVGNQLNNKKDVYVNILSLGKEEEYTLGDVNKDGVINFFDASLVLEYCEGDGNAVISKKAADVNLDDVIDRTDAELIQRYAAGNKDVFAK